ncbi:MAG: EcsC family protein [Myxococcaceae bacterium]|nr:EcsC family protein [Myxococcaceae bacterium]
MSVFDAYREYFSVLKPSNLKRLGNERLSDLVEREGERAKLKLDELTQRYPAAGPRELAQRFIDDKKTLASLVGGVSGIFGVLSVPPDLIVMTYLQLKLITEIATLYKVNLKSEPKRFELLDVYGYANGIGPVQRASPKVVAKLAQYALTKGGLHTIGKSLPLVAAPISAYLNNQHIQSVGDQAIRHYDGFDKAAEKTRKASGA